MNDNSELEYVGFWLRSWAAIIDTIVLILAMIPIFLLVYGRERMAEGVQLTGFANLFFSYLLPAAAVLAFWLAKQATPGKMLIGARIVDARTGAKPSSMQLLVRYLGYFVSLFFFGIGIFWVAFDRRKQGWHDKLARTVVVRPIRRGSESVKFG